MSPDGGFIHCHTCIGSTTFYDNIGKIGKVSSAYQRTLEEDDESDSDD